MKPEQQSFILEGASLCVRWMRYKGDFPAKSFLRKFPDDMSQFMSRVEELANFGTTMAANGKYLKGRYSSIYRIQTRLTRVFGFRIEDTFMVASAAKKRTSGQEPDYEVALRLREDYLTGNQDD